MISFDLETLGVESNAVILSVGCVKFEMSDIDRDVLLTPDERYQNYIKNGLFVKLDRNEQLLTGRQLETGAMEWWSKQAEIPISRSFSPRPDDLKAVAGIQRVAEYCKGHKAFWARGSMDQVVYDAMCRQYDQPTVAEYWDWSDFRTAINCLKNTAKRGYCDIAKFDRYQVCKHDPVHDAAYDAMMLLYGE